MDGRVQDCLRQVFGHALLRPAQATAIAHALADRDLLVVLPTGGGKSLCYQLPAAMSGGLTVVISPLVALMIDQVESLRGRGVAAGAWYAGQSDSDAAAVTQAVRQGRLRLAYLSPERLQAAGSRALLAAARPERVVVDEAHCVVAWGADFRPAYARLGGALAALGDPPVTALTASATREQQTAILHALGRPRARRVVAGIDRPEIFLACRRVRSGAERVAVLCSALRRVRGAALLYVRTRAEAEGLARHVAQRLGRSTAAYHAGLAPACRSELQAAFLANRLSILVATSAFGLGIDKADVRAVILASPPENVMDLYQCLGRAGRDGHPALGLMVYSEDDFRLAAWQIRATTPGTAELAVMLTALAPLGGEPSPLDETELAAATGLSPALARSTAVTLAGAGLIRRVSASRWAALRSPRAGELHFLCGRSAARRQDLLAQLERVADYAGALGCRRRTLLGHFGARIAPSTAACCDHCLATGTLPAKSGDPHATTGTPPAAAAPTATGQACLLEGIAPGAPNLRTRPAQTAAPPRTLPFAAPPFGVDDAVLAAVRNRDGHLTPRDVARYLTGAGSPAGGLDRADRAAVPGVTRHAVLAAIERLTSAGFLVVYHDSGRTRLALTRAGRIRLEPG